MARYYSVKCSYDAASQRYHRVQAAHNHAAQAAFVVAAMATFAAAVGGIGAEEVTTTNIRSNVSAGGLGADSIAI